MIYLILLVTQQLPSFRDSYNGGWGDPMIRKWGDIIIIILYGRMLL
jgi:hypothetical protein